MSSMNQLFVFAALFLVTCIAVGHGPNILKFLQAIPPEARAEMNAILKNSTLTKAQIETALDAWAAKQPDDFLQQYQEVKELLNTASNTATASSPTEQKILDIRKNKNITPLEERKAILEIVENDPELKNKERPPIISMV
ncbi:hypothetical protein M3Y94_00541600 [Aphelenchoides besseyi]|nr:hypothetical protein M3Y94_00541600 [Aphelenchoides besseyi]KAI6225756.1 hypothetical protein M3Y95_00730700 [Aphelenchoides besseyi]